MCIQYKSIHDDIFLTRMLGKNVRKTCWIINLRDRLIKRWYTFRALQMVSEYKWVLGIVAYLAFLLYLSQVQVEFQVQEEVEGCRRAVLRVLYDGFYDYCGRPNLFLFDGRTSCRLPLVLLNYLEIFLYSSIRTNWDRYLT